MQILSETDAGDGMVTLEIEFEENELEEIEAMMEICNCETLSEFFIKALENTILSRQENKDEEPTI
jgi:hypothetical protein